MKFVREDYRETQRKRNMAIGGAIVALIFIAIIGFNMLKKSPEQPVRDADGETAKTQTDTQKDPASSARRPALATSKNLPALVARVRKSVLLVKTYDASDKQIGQGSAFFVSKEGVIVSNRHVFKGAHHAVVEGVKGKYPVTEVLSQHKDYDLVRMKVRLKRHRITPLPIYNALPRIGEKILVIGNPLGLEASVSDGIVSAVRKLGPYSSVIQITSPISPGSSGSPVLNMRGEVIGVATFQMREGQNLNFAVPITYIKDLETVKNGKMAAVNFESSDVLEATENPFDKGMLLFAEKNYQGAIAFFLQALKENKDNADAHYRLGICYRETGATNAVEAFKSAIGLRPDFADAYYHLGLTYNQLNMPTEAISAFRQALKIDPNNDDALMNLGIAYSLNKNYKAAATTLEKALEIFPNAKAYFYLGGSYAELEQYEKGIQAFSRAIEMEPEMLDAYLALGASYVAIQYWTRGIKVMNKAVILAPENTEVHFVLGVLHLGNDDLASAEREYEILKKLKGDYKYRSELSRAISAYKRVNRQRYR